MAEPSADKYALDTLIHGLPHSTYLTAPGINASGLKEIVRSPAHYKAILDGEIESTDTPAKALGRAAHMAILEPERFDECYKVLPPHLNRRTAEGREEIAARVSAQIKDGGDIISQSDYDTCVRMRDKVHAVPFLSNLLGKGVREASLFYDDPRFNVRCKVRPDFISAKNIIVDLKTTLDARPKPFSRDIDKYMYHLQAAHYLVGGETSGLYRSDAFVFIAIEKRPPFEIGIYVTGPNTIAIGHQWRGFAMDKYAAALASNVWPGYPRKALTIDVPAWATVPEEENE